jgi:hypothetical protein
VRACAVLVATLLLGPVTASGADDPLAESRRLYNNGQYEEAERAASAALRQPASANGAKVILGRIQLERYRRSASPADLNSARAALRDVDPRLLEPGERVELTLGFAEALFLEDRFAAAADLFEPVLDSAIALGATAHERVLDWWATALDRHAQSRPMADRAAVYLRISRKMTSELSRDPASGAASYWIVAAMRGSGDVEGAWTAAMAAWVRAALTHDRGAALRGDLDRLMLQGIIPERAVRIAPREPHKTIAGLTGEWEGFKAAWSR